MVNPLLLPRTLVLLASTAVIVCSSIALSAAWWDINSKVTQSNYAGLTAGQQAQVNFELNSVRWVSNFQVNSSETISGSVSYSDVTPAPSELQTNFKQIKALVASELTIGIVFFLAMLTSFTRFRELFRKKFARVVLVVLGFAGLAFGIAALALIATVPSNVNQYYSSLFPAEAAAVLPTFDCTSDFSVGSISFTGSIPSCSSVWTTVSFQLSSDTVTVIVTFSTYTGAGWWWCVVSCFAAGAICLFFTPGRKDLFLESVPGVSAKKQDDQERMELQENRGSPEDSEEQIVMDKPANESELGKSNIEA